MSVSSSVPCIAILLLQLWGTHTFSPTPVCPTPCLCQKTPLLNCSSAGLSEAPSRIPSTAMALDLSHNAIHSLDPLGHLHLRGLLHFWIGDNALEGLSMCLERGVEGTKTLRRRNQWCVSWAPDLQLLSAERNQLKRIPRGLASIKSLQVLQLAHNQISELGPADLAGCTHLTEVHLQHNLIKTIHPQAFKDLPNLQVLHLSYNLLTIVPLPAYLSLRNLKTLVSISGNRWRCDCNFKTIRRWHSFDNELGNPTWKVDCFSPAHHAGKNLLYLEESDLTCPTPVYSTPGLLTEVTVEEGGELLLSCGADSQGLTQTSWWTPQGHVSENSQVLLISNITEQHAGHYVCISGEQEQHLSIFKVHVHKRVYITRQRREARNVNTQRNVRAVEQSQFVLAVCLSVFITFIVAFVLGVVLRPLLDKLWQRIKNKRDSSSSSTNSRISSTQPRPYVNEGFSETDEHVQEVRVGSRVTFGGVTDINDSGSNIPYYVTVEDAKSDSSSENNTDVELSYENVQGSEPLTSSVITHVELEDLRGKEGSTPSSTIEVSKEVPLREENPRTSAKTTEEMEFEPIPDPEDTTELEKRRISSVSSVSSESGFPQEEQTFHEGFESEEQSVDPPTVTTPNDETTIPEYTINPFSGTLSDFNEENVDDLDRDLWNDSGESFSFPDESPRSSSRITKCAVVDFPLFEEELSVDKQSNKLGSCNSSESGLTEGEQTEYTVNPEEDEESDMNGYPHSRNDDLNDTITPDLSDIRRLQGDRDSFDEEPFTDQSEFSDYSNGNFNAEELTEYYVHPVYRTGQKTIVSKIQEAGVSSCSDDEETQAENEDYPRKLEIKLDPEVKGECDIPVENPSNIITINFDNSSSSTDIEETHKEAVQPSEQSFFGKIGLPNVKKSLLFSVSDPQQYGSTNTLEAGSDSKTSHLNSSSEESFFEKFDVTLDSVPTVKRYFQLSHSEPQPSVLSTSTSLNTEKITPLTGTKPQSVRPDSSHEDELSPTTKGDRFFGDIGASVDTVPKVKRYIQFRSSDPQPLSPSTSLNTETITQHLVPKPQSGKYDSSFKDNYIPTTKESDPQPSTLSPTTSLKTEKITPMFGTKTESMTPGSSSEDEDSFFGQIGASVEVVPKVKRYIQFKPPVAQPSSPSTSLNTETITPNLVPKTQSVVQDNHSPTVKEVNFFEQIDTHLNGVPKIERYIQFTHSDVQPGSLSENEFSPTTNGDGFFEQIGASIDEVPKVQRYIQFAQPEPQPSALTPSTSLRTEKIIPVLGTNTQTMKPVSSSVDGDSFFKQIGTSIDEVPKVKRYIQFQPSETQPSSPPTSLTTGTITPNPVPKTQSGFQDNRSPTVKEKNFFEQFGISLDGVPKIQRYIQFTQSEVQPSVQSPSTLLNSERIPPKFVTTVQPKEGLSQTKGDGFFGEIGAIDDVPKVKRYIQFTQSQHQPSTLTQSPSLKTETITPVLGTTTQSMRPDSSSEDGLRPTTKGDSFFGQIGASVDVVPKVKRYIQFEPSDTQPSFPSLNTETVTPQLIPKTQSVSPVSSSVVRDRFFGQIGTSVGEVPKVKRYIKFSPSDPLTSPLSPSSLKTEKILPVIGTTTQSMGPDSSSHIEASDDKVPKVKRYIQFTPSETQPSTLSQTTSLKTEKITPVLGTKAQSMKPDSSSEDGLIPTTKGETGAPFNGVPKVKRYIQFSHSEPQTLKTENITPVIGNKTQSIRPDSLSDDEVFFGASEAFIDGVPKVKQYIQFTSVAQASTPSTYLNTETITANVVPQTQSLRPDFSSEDREGFFGQINASIDGVPQVKRYIQFSHSEPLSSTLSPSTSLKTENVIPVIENKTQSMRPNSSSADESSFFRASGASFDGLPKVKRYIQFLSEDQCLSPSSNTETITPTLVSKTQSGKYDSSFQDNLSPTTKEENFFEQTAASIDEVPKIQRYIQFSQSEVQPDSSFDNRFSPTTKGEGFFGQIGTSLDGVPKVQRYIQFSQPEIQPSAPSTVLNSERIPPKFVTTVQSEERLSQSKGDVFVGQEDTHFHGVPKVKRYIQFSQSEPLSQTSSPTKETGAITHTGTGAERNNSPSEDGVNPAADEHSFFGPKDASPGGIPKVKKYIQFTHSASQLSAQSPTQDLDRPISTQQFLTKTESPDDVNTINKDNLFVLTDTSLYEIPKVKRYIQFTECESSPSGIPSEVKPSSDKDSFLGGISVPLDDIPKMQRSLHFTQSDMKVATETSVLDQFSRPKRTLFFSNSDPYGQSDQSFTSPQPRLSQRISQYQFDDDEDLNAQHSSPASPGKDDAREYLRDSSQARQKQERRRLLFTQKRRAMDGFKLTTHSSTVQSSSNPNEETFPVYKRNIFLGVSTGIADTASHKATEPESLSAKSISPLRYKYRSDV